MQATKLEPRIICPYCQKEIRLNEAILSPFYEKWQKESEARYDQQLDTQRKKIREEEQDKLTKQFEVRKKELDKQEIEQRKSGRELKEKQEAFDVELQRKVDEQTEKIREKHSLEVRERDERNEELRKRIKDLEERAERGSSVTKGEAGEHELKEILESTFPDDEILEVRRGARGADILQHINKKVGRHCGTLLWESKNTKNWSERWLKKLREDQRQKKADFGILASVALPKHIKHFQIEGDICVTGLHLAPALAGILRRNLIELASKQVTAIDRTNKKERLYDYVSSTQFRQKVQAVAEPLLSMLKDLNQEKIAMQKIWDKREQEIKSAGFAIGGAYGDMQGIMGAMALPEIEVLQLPSGNT